MRTKIRQRGKVTYMARRKRQEAEIERSRGLILAAAARVFAQNGFQASSMAAIAKEAGYTAPTLYTYFDGKMAIYHALGETVLCTISSIYKERSPAGMTYEQKLELLLMRLFKGIDTLKDAFSFFMALRFSSDSVPSDDGDYEKRFTPELTKCAVAWQTEHLRHSRYSALSPELVTLFIQGVVKSFAENWAAKESDRDFVEEISTVVPLILGGLEGLVRSLERSQD
jgi:AcrR family transcriptional regulator